jgi:hypothetical protein
MSDVNAVDFKAVHAILVGVVILVVEGFHAGDGLKADAFLDALTFVLGER